MLEAWFSGSAGDGNVGAGHLVMSACRTVSYSVHMSSTSVAGRDKVA
jgi:hypothetical protein